MLPCVRVKPGVQFSVIAPGGFAILAGLVATADFLGYDITITSGTDGEHSGPDDPHHRGEAYDVRTHGMPDKNRLLEEIQSQLHRDYFFAFIEDEGEDNEHIHVQVRKGTVYPPIVTTSPVQV